MGHMTDKTKVIRVFETFAGIGAQHKAIKNINMNFKVVGTSEWDARAVIAYAQIHHKKAFEGKIVEIGNWSEKQMDEYLKNKTFSLNSKNPGQVTRKSIDFKKNLIAANIVNNNFPNIKEVSGGDIKGVDLLTYSFPCQGLSIANMGRDQGIKESANSTSNLIWEIRRILLDAKGKDIRLPKYLLMENVKNLLSKKHIEDYERWKSFLKSLGYETNTVILNGLNHRSLQKRERVFGISTLNPKAMKTDNDVKKAIEAFGIEPKKFILQREKKYKGILNSSPADEVIESIPKYTTSRIKMQQENIDLENRSWRSDEYKWIFNTLTTKQDRHPNIGMVPINKELLTNGGMSKRFITPREAYQIMGFESEDFTSVKEKYLEGFITKEALYRQAGNSVVVTVLEDVFKYIMEMEKNE